MARELHLTDLQPLAPVPSESLTGIPARPPVLATDHSILGPGEREFIIVGQERPEGFTLWDVVPAPTDPVRRAMDLEVIGVDAMDALGSVHVVRGTTARRATGAFIAGRRYRSGRADYALTADSASAERIDEADGLAPGA